MWLKQAPRTSFLVIVAALVATAQAQENVAKTHAEAAAPQAHAAAFGTGRAYSLGT